ncbi:Spore germination protein B1 [bioreactor metagenome]|uniref:Spore germination protein B1 n=1 Tax=bioreactor metagenome TaxID=1076179 RepID=A0A645D5D0_9ZZZZ
MLFAFEILREAGIRLPRPVGQSISIVGALVMGDAAVSAGLVGAPVLIAIAIAAVAGFLVPAQNDSASILRVCMMLLGSFAGWYGIAMGFLAMMLHLGSLYSFGVPYFDGFTWSTNLQDSVVRMPMWSMVRRPKDIARGDTTRHRFFIPPMRPYAQQDEDDSENE